MHQHAGDKLGRCRARVPVWCQCLSESVSPECRDHLNLLEFLKEVQ
jgi:hypothetical protein